MYKRIRDLREEKDTKQETIAKQLNISQTTYSRYETGVLDIPSQTLQNMALFYETSVDYILGLTDEKKPYPRKNSKCKG